jgi:hypothetical protein
MTTLRRSAAIAAALAALTLAGCASGAKTVKTDQAAATTIEEPVGDAPGDTFPDEGIATTTRPVTAANKVGESGTVSDSDTGQDLYTIAVTKVRFVRGDEYNRPERGWFLGAYVKVKALADEQSVPYSDLYVQMRGHHYDADGCCPDGFTPTLDYVDLNEGETSEGWLVFDVPAKHGEVVLTNSYGSGGKIGTWSF